MQNISNSPLLSNRVNTYEVKYIPVIIDEHFRIACTKTATAELMDVSGL